MCLVNAAAVLITNPILACSHKCAPHACKTKNQILKYICSMLKEVIIKIKRTYRGYGYDDPPEQVPQINGRVRDVQVTPIVEPPTPVISQIS